MILKTKIFKIVNNDLKLFLFGLGFLLIQALVLFFFIISLYPNRISFAIWVSIPISIAELLIYLCVYIYQQFKKVDTKKVKGE